MYAAVVDHHLDRWEYFFGPVWCVLYHPTGERARSLRGRRRLSTSAYLDIKGPPGCLVRQTRNTKSLSNTLNFNFSPSSSASQLLKTSLSIATFAFRDASHQESRSSQTPPGARSRSGSSSFFARPSSNHEQSQSSDIRKHAVHNKGQAISK